jgi:3',5'-cyclic AMP phosphodiesterase CpdA
MFVLAHLSDLHLASRPRAAELVGKRGLGFINWLRKRRYIHRADVLDAITHDAKLYGADHIAVTGDLVNLSLPDEYRRARAWLDRLGPPREVTVIPGNHDSYVGSAASSPAKYWGDYMRGDDGPPDLFPFLRRRGEVALIALSSAVPTGPFMATGTLGAQQLNRLAALLDRTAGAFRIVLIHHPPMSPPRRYLRRLTDGEALRRVLAARGAELLLHGHDHRCALVWLDGPRGTKIPAAGVPSASASSRHGNEDQAGYNVFRIEARASAANASAAATGPAGTSAWRCEMIARQRTGEGIIRDVSREELH